EGISLREYLRRFHPLPPANCLWIARQVAEGLAALGEKGWAHCDVKPENIQVARNGHATLCDLGLARRLTPGQKGDAALVGTPAYMAPESFTPGEARTPAADSYGLGIVLFELLAGRRPFPHTDAEELMAAHRMVRAPDPRTIRPDLPARIAQLVRSLLAKEPMRRPTGRELITALVDAEIDLFEQRRVA
ncbi:MAG: serine/threonine-protein kinase, partial [Pirellulaceae bacterium]